MGDLVPVLGGGGAVIAVIVSLAIALLRQVGAGAKDHSTQVASWVQLNKAANDATAAANGRAAAAEKRAAAAEHHADELRTQADEMRQLAEAIAAGTAARLSEMDAKVARLLELQPGDVTDGT